MYSRDVFLSYTGTDSSYAETLYEDLCLYGAKVWFDKVDMPNDHRGDANLIRHHLRRALRDSRGLLLLISGRSLASRWVKYEMDTLLAMEAKQPRRRVVAVLVGRGSLKDLPGDVDIKVHDLKTHFEQRYNRAREEIFRDVLERFDLKKFSRTFR